MTGTPRRRMPLIVLTLLLAVAGCGDELVVYTPETDAEREVRESREKLQRTVGEGGLAGAGVGAVVGAAAGGVSGAFQGAQLGRLGGAAAGGYVKQLQQTYADEEALLDAVVADLRATNARMDESIRAMQAALRERQNAAQASAVRNERLRVEVDDTLDAAVQQEAFFVNTRSLLISDGIGASGAMDPELARLRDRVRSMQRISETLGQI